jgi:hypothetical protein
VVSAIAVSTIAAPAGSFHPSGSDRIATPSAVDTTGIR